LENKDKGMRESIGIGEGVGYNWGGGGRMGGWGGLNRVGVCKSVIGKEMESL
jgi:hypothetical protein